MDTPTDGPAALDGTHYAYFDALVTVPAAGDHGVAPLGAGGPAGLPDAFSLVECWAPEGHTTPWYAYEAADELLYVLDGVVSVFTRESGEQASHHVERGELRHLPAGTEHAVRVEGGDARYLLLSDDPELEDWFVELGTRREAYELPPETDSAGEKVAAMRAAAPEFDIEVSGPLSG